MMTRRLAAAPKPPLQNLTIRWKTTSSGDMAAILMRKRNDVTRTSETESSMEALAAWIWKQVQVPKGESHVFWGVN